MYIPKCICHEAQKGGGGQGKREVGDEGAGEVKRREKRGREEGEGMGGGRGEKKREGGEKRENLRSQSARRSKIG